MLVTRSAELSRVAWKDRVTIASEWLRGMRQGHDLSLRATGARPALRGSASNEARKAKPFLLCAGGFHAVVEDSLRFADRLTPSVLNHDKLQFALYFKTVASLVLGEWRAM